MFFFLDRCMVTECSRTMQSEEIKSHKPASRQKADKKKTTKERPVKKRRVSKEMEAEPKEQIEEVKKSPGKDPIGAIIGRKRKGRKSGKRENGGL